MEKRLSCSFVIGIIILCVLLVVIFDSGVSVAEAEDYLDIYDKVFIETVTDFGIGNDRIEFTRDALYDMDEKFLGFVFDYKSDNEIGYAVLLRMADGIKVAELCPGSVNPYDNLQGMPIYVCEFNYWGKVGEEYISLYGNRLNKDDMKNIFSSRYESMIDEFVKSNKIVHYINKSETKFNLAERIPNYTYSNISNACVPIAAGNIVAYFDRYCTNLIANR